MTEPTPRRAAAFPKRNYGPRPPKRAAPQARTAWEKPASWYDRLQGEAGDDFYQHLILPAVLRRLHAASGQRVLDICCGQGVLGRALAKDGVRSLGVDASPTLIAAARERAGPLEAHVLGDARKLTEAVSDRSFDHAALVMALQDVDRMADVLAGAAALVKPRGRLVIVLTHPCFRIPKRSSWGWDQTQGMAYRRLDGYLSTFTAPILIHPGDKADATKTLSFHRPISTYLEALGNHGWGVIGAEELCSHRRGTKGVRSSAEDHAAKEFPVFLVLVAQKLA